MSVTSHIPTTSSMSAWEIKKYSVSNVGLNLSILGIASHQDVDSITKSLTWLLIELFNTKIPKLCRTCVQITALTKLSESDFCN